MKIKNYIKNNKIIKILKYENLLERVKEKIILIEKENNRPRPRQDHIQTYYNSIDNFIRQAEDRATHYNL